MYHNIKDLNFGNVSYIVKEYKDKNIVELFPYKDKKLDGCIYAYFTNEKGIFSPRYFIKMGLKMVHPLHIMKMVKLKQPEFIKMVNRKDYGQDTLRIIMENIYTRKLNFKMVN